MFGNYSPEEKRILLNALQNPKKEISENQQYLNTAKERDMVQPSSQQEALDRRREDAIGLWRGQDEGEFRHRRRIINNGYDGDFKFRHNPTERLILRDNIARYLHNNGIPVTEDNILRLMNSGYEFYDSGTLNDINWFNDRRKYLGIDENGRFVYGMGNPSTSSEDPTGAFYRKLSPSALREGPEVPAFDKYTGEPIMRADGSRRQTTASNADWTMNSDSLRMVRDAKRAGQPKPQAPAWRRILGVSPAIPLAGTAMALSMMDPNVARASGWAGQALGYGLTGAADTLGTASMVSEPLFDAYKVMNQYSPDQAQEMTDRPLDFAD